MTDYAPPEFRAAAVADVNYVQRRIDVLAVPYDVEAEIWDQRHGDYRESFAPNAFNGAQRRLSGRDRITVNRDHDDRRLIGKVLALHPARKDGLVAELRMTQNLPLADETLSLAADDVLGASISFSPMPGGEQWSPDRRSRRVTKARLHHIALVPEPAYADAAVLSVRADMLNNTQLDRAPASGTPWLDQIRLDRLAARYGVT